MLQPCAHWAHRWRLAIALAAVVGLFCTADTTAHAQTDPERASTLYREAREADDAGEFERAATLYRDAIALQPSARWASRTIARLRALDRLNADPAVAALDALKADFDRENPGEHIAAAEALIDTATTDQGRAAVHLWLGLQKARFLDRRDQAIDHFVAASQPEGATPSQVESALLYGVREARTWDQNIRMRQAVIHAQTHRTDLDSDALVTPRDEVDDAIFGRIALPTSWVAVALLSLLFVVRRGWQHRGHVHRFALGLLVYAFAVGGIAAERWEHGYAPPFFAAIGVALIVHVLSVGVRPTDDAGRANRFATAFAIACGTVGAYYIVFDLFEHQAVFGL